MIGVNGPLDLNKILINNRIFCTPTSVSRF